MSDWLETLRDDVLATLGDPGDTIVPPTLQTPAVTTNGARALAGLAKASGAASLRLGSVIGEGGMGIVHEAEQVPLGRMVAVKTLRPTRRDQAAAIDLLREAWVTGILEHPNIVPVHYLELDPDGMPVIVLKRITGVEWSQLSGDADAVRSRFGATDLLAWNLSILIQVLDALRFAHSRGIVHRDLKPTNVMVGEFGEVYLLDWGIAVTTRDDPTGRLPRANAEDLAGTPVYMAPEMLGRPDGPPLSARTDIYLAGAVLFELIAGHPPHDGATALEVIASILHVQPTLPPTSPPELTRICERAMHPDPEQRFEAADAMQLALRRYLEHRGAAELASRAHARLAQLHDVIEVTPAKTTIHREEVYRLFGACRFGFHEALAAWPDSEDAKAGLVAATVAVARYELDTDNPSAAVTLLAEIDAPLELASTARAAAAAHQARQRQLEQVRDHHDPGIGKRTRLFLSAIVGVVFTLFPLLAALGVQGGYLDHAPQLGLSLGFTALACYAGWWARDTLFRTAINRRLLFSGILLFAAQALLVGSLWIAGLPSQLDAFLLMEVSAILAWACTIAVDSWLMPSAIAYTLAFPLAARWFDQRMWLIAASNFVLAVNVVWRWWPGSWRPSPAEREAMARRKASR